MFRRKSAPVGAIGGSTKVVASASAGRGLRSRLGRSQSTPAPRRSKDKGVMKFVTADDSLHSTYGEAKSDTSPESINNSNGSTVVKKGITFHYIEIREYNRTIGDNPSCSSGPPIAISWEYNPDTKIISVDQYEQTRPARRTHFEMVLPRDLRQKMLRKEWDVTQNQIAAAIRNNVKVKNQRRQTINNLGKSTKVEEAVESASRSVFRGLMGNSTDKQVAKLEKQMQEAERARKQAQLEAEMLGEYEDDDDNDETIEDENASLVEDRFVACEATQDKKVLPQIVPQRPESPMPPPIEQNPIESRQDSTPRQPPRPLQSPVRTHKPTLVVAAEEKEYHEEKTQDLNGTSSPLQPPSQGLPRHANPILVIEEESSSDSEEEPHHHKHANPQETSVSEVLQLPSVKKPSLPPTPLPMKMPLTNGTNTAAAVSSPSPPPTTNFPDTKKKMHNIIPQVTHGGSCEDEEDADECCV